MIRYALKCKAGHAFESWFANAYGYESLRAAGHVACPICGDTDVSKSLMTPGVRPARTKAAAPAPETTAPSPPTAAPVPAPTTPEEVMRAQLVELKKKVEANSDYVGLQFASEARAMHEGEIPHRAIYGEAKPQEAKKLLEEGVPVAPLPFMPTRKTN